MWRDRAEEEDVKAAPVLDSARWIALFRSQRANDFRRGGVHFSLWGDAYASDYAGLIVNSGAFDACNPDAITLDELYPLPHLRNRILADWPMFLHDARHQGYSRFYDTTTTEDLTQIWTADVDTTSATHIYRWFDHPIGGKSTTIFHHPYIDSSPVHAAGCPVIVGGYIGDYLSSTGYVKAFGPTTNTEVWRFPSDEEEFIGGVASTPAIFTVGEQKRVVFGSMDGKVYCLRVHAEGSDPAGSCVWSYQTASSGSESARVLASPVVYDGRVYIGNESATLYCLNASTGALIWSQQFPRDGTWPDRTGLSSVAIGPTASGEMRAYVGSDNGHVYCLSLEDNPHDRVIWDYNGEDGQGIGCVESSPTIYAGNVYVGTSWYGGNDVVALDAASGQFLWSQGLLEEARATCAAMDGHVFIGVDTGTKFYRLLAADGFLDPDPSLTNPFDAANHRPQPPNSVGSDNYFVGSAALTSAGFCIVGNDNYALYAMSNVDLALPTLRPTGGVVCSSAAVSYAAESPYRWTYVLSRAGGGTLLAYRQQLSP